MNPVTVINGVEPEFQPGLMLNTKEAAEHAGVSESTIRTWVDRGQLKVAGKVGRANLYTLAAVGVAEKASRDRATLRNNIHIAGRQILDHRARNQAA